MQEIISYLVTDSLGCQGSNSITIIEPALFTIYPSIIPNASGFDVSCPGVSDGNVEVTPVKGLFNRLFYYKFTFCY